MSDLKGNLAIMMVGMIAQSSSEEALVDNVINKLTQYKLGGFKKDDRPRVDVLAINMKWSKISENGAAGLEDLMQTLEEYTQAKNLVNKMKSSSN